MKPLVSNGGGKDVDTALGRQRASQGVNGRLLVGGGDEHEPGRVAGKDTLETCT